ncbi:MAG: SpaH/EbpB family LPXTG-anchored major pilin [Oscillospiraceae bacterium]|nr:SpaH/EbpB family LPXTG-anchored major pilin [Oscillospiraceae bacterium]
MKTNIKRILAAMMALAILFSLSLSAFAAATPEATIDYTRTGSLSLYKYDMTSAAEDGVWNTESYVSTGLKNDEAEQTLNPYAVQGVEFTFLRVASIETFSDIVDGESVTKVLYGVPATEQDMAFLTALGLTAADAYTPATKTVDGTTWYYYESDTLITALRNKLDANATEIKNALENVVKTQGGTAMPETDAYGHSEAQGLELGLYLVVETRVPEDVVNTTSPFFASLPMTTIDGSEWNYDLVLYPKNATGGPTLEKTLREANADTGKNNGSDEITDGYAHTGTASDGDIVDYQIISRLPVITSRASYLTTYTFVDTLCKGVTYNKSDVKLEWFTDADCTEKITEWTETDEDLKFSVSYADGADDAEVMTIAMTAAGLAEINGSAAVYGSDSIYSGYSECYVRITYTGTVNSDATVVYGDSGNPNEVTLEWRRTNTAYYDTLKDCCHLYVYGIEVSKRFSDNTGNFGEVTFTVFNETDGYWLKAEQAEDGLYYVTDHVATEDEATSFIPNTETGVLKIWGLEDDAYTVTETHTAKGYTLLKDSISIVITASESDTFCEICGAALLTASATVNGKPVTMLENNGSVNAVVPLTVINTKGPDLPVTGDNGVWMYGVFGTLLMTAAAAAIILAMKSKKAYKRKQ